MIIPSPLNMIISMPSSFKRSFMLRESPSNIYRRSNINFAVYNISDFVNTTIIHFDTFYHRFIERVWQQMISLLSDCKPSHMYIITYFKMYFIYRMGGNYQHSALGSVLMWGMVRFFVTLGDIRNARLRIGRYVNNKMNAVMRKLWIFSQC